MNVASSDDPLRKRGILLLLLTALLWSSGGVFIKISSLTPLTIAGGRSAIAALVMILWLKRPKFSWTPAQFGTAICYALTVSLFVVATKLTTAANAIFLQYTAPLWVGVFSWIVARERLTRIDVITLVVVMAGMSTFFIDRVDAGHTLGNIIGLAAGVVFGGVALFLRAQRGESTTESILLGNILTACLCLPFASPFTLEFINIGPLLALGIFQLGISYILYSWALKHVTAIEAILITTLEPLLNPIWVALFYGETPSLLAAIGGGIVVAAIVGRNFAYAKFIRTV